MFFLDASSRPPYESCAAFQMVDLALRNLEPAGLTSKLAFRLGKGDLTDLATRTALVPPSRAWD